MFVCLSEQAGLKVSQALPEKVKIVEVGPRDGLQNEKVTLFINIYSQLIHLNGSNTIFIISVALP